MTETEVQGVGTPAILFVQPMIEAFNKSDSNTIGIPLEVKDLPLLAFSLTTPL